MLFNNGIISKVVESNEFVQCAFITGISFIGGRDLCGLNTVEACKFLDHSIVEFYGLTEGEVTKGLDKFKTEKKIRKEAHDQYNG